MTFDKWKSCLELLADGNYQEGWPEHAVIRSGKIDTKDDFVSTTSLGLPVWDGSPVDTLLVNAEFGMGDTIMFYRFIAEAQKRVKQRIILRCDEDFESLFRNVSVLRRNDPIPNADVMIHMMALPRMLGCPSISGQPYLMSDAQQDPLGLILRAMNFTRIGLCWQGNPFNPRDKERSMPVEFLRPLFVAPGMKFFSLVKHVEPPKEGFIDIRGMMTNWNSTAVVLDAMHLVITVDTAIAHLAGALGKPVWLLLPESPDWRWGKSGEQSCWYDSVRIFRQTSSQAELIERVATAIKEAFCQ